MGLKARHFAGFSILSINATIADNWVAAITCSTVLIWKQKWLKSWVIDVHHLNQLYDFYHLYHSYHRNMSSTNFVRYHWLSLIIIDYPKKVNHLLSDNLKSKDASASKKSAAERLLVGTKWIQIVPSILQLHGQS